MGRPSSADGQMKYPENKAGMRLLVLACTIFVGACAAPGQSYKMQSSVNVPAANVQQPQVIPLTANVIANEARSSTSLVTANHELDEQIRNYEYRVGTRDILIFTVWDHPELTIPAGEFRSAEVHGHLVSSSGDIFFPYVGTISVGGSTLVEIRGELTTRLSQFINNPQLDARIAAFRSKRINVTGHVMSPGFFPITDTPMTLVDAVDLAGGPTPEAAIQQVQVLRDDSLLTFDMVRLLQGGDLKQNILLQDGDVIYVPENSYYAVHVLGSVAKPGAVAIAQGRLNLAEAISRSDGFDNESANASQLLVFRNQPTGPVVYWLDAKSPGGMLLATQFELLPQDVVYVASTRLAKWNRVVSQLLPTIQSLWQTKSLVDRL